MFVPIIKMLRHWFHILFVALFVPLAGCFTGVENTGHVTERDVKRAIAEASKRESTTTLAVYRDSVPAWKQGKQFFVCDDQVRLLFAYSPTYDIDSIHLAGKVLLYDGYETGSLLDNRSTVNLRFTDGAHSFLYRTEKTIDEFSSTFSIPMLIDMDEVRHAASQLVGKEFYVKTPIWYSPLSNQMSNGRQFVKVRIDSVTPGNKVFPLKVLFTALDRNERAYLWVSTGRNAIQGRDFDALFTQRDVRQKYSNVSDENWQRIINGRVAVGMTKEECRLAKGAPKSISEIPDQRGMREYWLYDGGSYLFFVDGLLSESR